MCEFTLDKLKMHPDAAKQTLHIKFVGWRIRYPDLIRYT